MQFPRSVQVYCQSNHVEAFDVIKAIMPDSTFLSGELKEYMGY